MQDYFEEICAAAESALQRDEIYLANFRAEDSLFLRFNKSAVRQPGRVREVELALTLIRGQKQAEARISLCGALDEDRARVRHAFDGLREGIGAAADDPFLLYSTHVHSSARKIGAPPPDADALMSAILRAGEGRDLVGFAASGPVNSGFANALGQRNWDEASSFNLDWSFYHAGDKAVKAGHAGFAWDEHAFRQDAERAAAQLEALSRPARSIPPGEYRAYLTPAAMNEIMGMLAWGGFGLAAHRTRSTVFLKMIEGGAGLSPKVTLREASADGAAPGFQSEGFIKPGRVTLIDEGAYGNCLISPRSAAEYGALTNGANGAETPVALDMAPGDLPEADVLKALGEGIYVSNLWYLNFSDRSAGRLTGMTRFACFWVEKGEIVAPLNVMRFDDTIYRLLGTSLEALTAERHFILDPGTYGGRSLESARLPGALLSGIRFTL